MTDKEKQQMKEDQREEKRATEGIEQSARYQAIRKADMAREEAIQKTSKAKEIKRAEKRAADDIRQSAKYQAIRKADLAREQAITESQEAAKLKVKKQPPH